MQALILRVLVVDDIEIVRRGICQILQAQADIEVVSEAVDGADALRKEREHRPDVVLMDITMPVMNSFDATRHIKHEFPSILNSRREPVRLCSICERSNRGWRERISREEQCQHRIDSNVAKDSFPTHANVMHEPARHVCSSSYTQIRQCPNAIRNLETCAARPGAVVSRKQPGQ